MQGKTETAHRISGLKAFEEHESNVRSYIRAFPALFSHAEGSVIFDQDGNSYIDFLSGAGALNYGHNNPEMKAALLAYIAGNGVAHSLDMATEAKRSFICDFKRVILDPRNLDYKFLFPGPTGANAIEAALKVARKATGRETVFAFEGGFHGMTLGALAITSNEDKRAGAGQPLGGSRFMPFDGESAQGLSSLSFLRCALEQAAGQDALPAALFLETVQCEGGVRVAGTDWLQAVEGLCRCFGVLLVVDDIQAGCGRTGSFFSFENAGLTPDIVCLSKSLSGFGLPMALVLLKRELDVLAPGEHNGTFRGHNLAFVTARRALNFWRDTSFSDEIHNKSQYLVDRLKGIVSRTRRSGVDLRGRGLVHALVFAGASDAMRASEYCFQRKLLVETAGHRGEVLKLMPPLTIGHDELDGSLQVLEECLRELG